MRHITNAPGASLLISLLLTLSTLGAGCNAEDGDADRGSESSGGVTVDDRSDDDRSGGGPSGSTAAKRHDDPGLAASRQKPVDPKLALALESLRSARPLDRSFALSGIAPAAVSRREPEFVVPALTWLFANPTADVKNRAQAGAYIAMYREDARSAVPYAIEALAEKPLVWSSLRILAAVGSAAKPASAKVLAVLRDDTAPAKNRKLAIEILTVTERTNPTFTSILRTLQETGSPALKEAAGTALKRS